MLTVSYCLAEQRGEGRKGGRGVGAKSYEVAMFTIPNAALLPPE